ncbi:MAG: 1,2-phenylacetyl-CoA epoxidase subunit PaaD [Pseudomonadota bacterium]
MPEAIPLMPAEQYAVRRARAESAIPEVWEVLDAVKDPEIPVVSIWELGILRSVEMQGDEVVVTITPTYSGCPAMDAITQDVEKALEDAGYTRRRVVMQWAPAWSTSWIAPAAKDSLRQFGIAPPGTEAVSCPHCGSTEVERVSEFGSTACKALYQCGDCLEPFDLFKNL